MSGRGIVEAGAFRSELIESNARTTDPTNPALGDWWIRSDVQPSVDGATTVAALRIQGSGGVLEIPFFDSSEESNLGADVYVGERFRFDDGAVGFIAETDQGGSLGSPRLVAPDGTEYQAHDSLEVSAIPDSAVLQLDSTLLTGFSDEDEVTERVDRVGSVSVNPTGSGVYRTNAINGRAGIEYSGDDGHRVDDSTLAQKYVIYAVIDGDFGSSPSQNQDVVDEGTTNFNFQYNSTGVWNLFAGSTIEGSTDPNSQLLTAVVDGSDSLLREDGTQTASGNVGGSDLSLISVADGGFVGDIPFVEVHDGDVSNGLQTREQEIADLFGITI